MLLVSDVASDCRDREAFQEVDYAKFFGLSIKGCAKRVGRIDEADRLPEYVALAFATAVNSLPSRAGVARRHADPGDGCQTFASARASTDKN